MIAELSSWGQARRHVVAVRGRAYAATAGKGDQRSDPYAVLVALAAEALTTVANILAGSDPKQEAHDLAETGDAVAWYARTLPTPAAIASRPDISTGVHRT